MNRYAVSENRNVPLSALATVVGDGTTRIAPTLVSPKMVSYVSFFRFGCNGGKKRSRLSGFDSIRVRNVNMTTGSATLSLSDGPAG